MPVYEYRCGECDEKFELFVRSATEQAAPVCPRCGGHKVRKSISLFGVGGASESRPASTVSCGPGPA